MATVRRAKTEDAVAISAIIGEILEEGLAISFERALDADEVRTLLDRQGDVGATFVADEGGEVVAFGSLDPDPADPSECTFGSWVQRTRRRQGIGTALAEEALAFARDRGYRRIRGRLPAANEPALSYLSAIGALVPLTNPGASFELPLYPEPS
ncbi:MAG: GNAT family N-acetyltransferase [Chloroflexi bacterium]|nr:GNAT family N-acetyltransferase [Chloroflexota bacterium]MQC19370.1 GNAT family N-acetyltransferase [Chloroflexota bacterium]